MTEAVVVKTGAISRAKLQSNHHHQQTNTQFLYRPDALPVTQPTCQSTGAALFQVYDDPILKSTRKLADKPA